MKHRTWLPYLTGLMLTHGLSLAPTAGAETAAERDQRMGWFREARFGLFIHWGVYAVPAGEWKGNKNYGEWFLEETKMPVSEYEKYAAQFNPVKFDAREWVRMAKEAGMKYLVITSKHHDGFGLWRSASTDWCIKSTPFQRDPMKELAVACREAGLKFCFYHSIMDWHHADYTQRRPWNDRVSGTPDMDRYVAFMKGQLKELVTGYGPLGILWFDGEWEAPWTHQRGLDLYDYVRGLQPDIIVNNRVGKGRAGMDGMDRGAERVGDYGTPEQEIPPTGFGPGVDWESCMTMNNHWGYNQHDQNWKSTTTLVRNLIDCASKGGNYLLNVGPTSEGLFPAASVQRLAEIGQWMKVNHPAIYGTTASPFKKLAWGRCTQKPGKLYLHVFDWPTDGQLSVPLASPVRRAYLLAAPDRSLSLDGGPAGIVLQVPRATPTPHAGVVVLEIDGPPQPIEARVSQAGDGTLILKAADADLIGHTLRLETKGDGAPNIGHWTNPQDHVQWLVTVNRTGTFDVEANYACDPASEGSEYVMSFGDEHLSGTVPATRGWDDFASDVAGQINLRNRGPLTVTVKATSKPGQGVVNLRSLVLRPVF
ncbi:MAG: alpha-L-fucosidase [Verrucomicrobia bacterium]|nr:alpha-L-fucosidase [Verrucomicrobiota bacterium]